MSEGMIEVMKFMAYAALGAALMAISNNRAWRKYYEGQKLYPRKNEEPERKRANEVRRCPNR